MTAANPLADHVAVQSHAAQIRQAITATGAVWAPFFNRHVALVLQPSDLRALTRQASCARLETAMVLAEHGFETIILTRPLIRVDELMQLRDLIRRTAVSVVIDHFRHAELLSLAAVEARSTIGVLIDVDLGRQTTGVRPGPDAARLAIAAATMPGLRIDGVHFDGWQLESGAGCREPQQAPTALCDCLTIARHAKRSIEQGRAVCSGIVAGRFVDPRLLVDVPDVNVWLCDPGAGGNPEPARHESLDSRLRGNDGRGKAPGGDASGSGEATTLIQARVLSRPALEWCVIDAGVEQLGSLDSVCIAKPAGAGLLHASDDVATVGLTGDALDLTIGDPVVLLVADQAQ